MTEDPRIAVMEARIRDLENALGQSNPELALAFRLPPALNNLLGLLLALPVVTHAVIETNLELVTNARVAMHRLRQNLEPFGITVLSRRTVGYWLDNDNKTRVRELMAPGAKLPAEVTAPAVMAAA